MLEFQIEFLSYGSKITSLQSIKFHSICNRPTDSTTADLRLPCSKSLTRSCLHHGMFRSTLYIALWRSTFLHVIRHLRPQPVFHYRSLSVFTPVYFVSFRIIGHRLAHVLYLDKFTLIAIREVWRSSCQAPTHLLYTSGFWITGELSSGRSCSHSSYPRKWQVLILQLRNKSHSI